MAAVDRRRNAATTESVPVQILGEAARKRTRGAQEMRKIFLKTGLVTKANGSAFMETENIKVAAAVYGPRQVKTGQFSPVAKLNAEVSFAPFSGRARVGYVAGAKEKDFSLHLQSALAPSVRLDLFPKSVVDVYVNVLEMDGQMATLAAAVTCASAAIADAGIDCMDTVTGSSAFLKEGQIYLDPEEADEGTPQEAQMMVAYLAALGELSEVYTRGSVDTGKSTGFESLLSACIDAAAEVRVVSNNALLEGVKGTLSAKDEMQME